MTTAERNGAASPEELVERVQELTAELDSVGDPSVRARAEELVGAIIELYGTGLERIAAILDDAGEPGAELRERLAATASSPA